jgi:hypothetical protein
MSEFNLATANAKQLKTYAANNYDLKLSLTMSADTMRERIAKHCEENGLEAPVAKIQTKHDVAKKSNKTVTINIAKSDKTGGAEPVFVGYQGVGYLIPRGIDIQVSPAIEHILKNAVTDNVTQDGDGEVHHDEVPTYPYSARFDQAAG